MLGGLRTAYPFCCGSRHHSDWPNGPCWLIRMFQPKWSLIQSTVFPWAREWAGRARIPSIIYSNSRFVSGPHRANGTWSWAPGLFSAQPKAMERQSQHLRLLSVAGEFCSLAGGVEGSCLFSISIHDILVGEKREG